MKSFTIAGLGALLLIAATGCQTMTGRTLGQNVDDNTLKAEVKTKLAADHIATLTRVDVDVVNGVVYLKGVVPTEQARAEADRTARSVNGVRSLVDNLTVQSAAAPPAPVVASSAPSASPMTEMTGHHMMAGQITRIDHTTGRLTVATPEGPLDVHFPPASVRDLQPGDRIQVDLGFRRMQ
jgi:translation elongation factor EF-1beta